jgi:L-histidine Nalpha-methyltransferase
MSAALDPREPSSAFARDVRRGLAERPRTLPPRYFYDALGSQLFEAICRLPWYPITRAERALLGRHAAEMARSVADLRSLIELGSGSGEKIALLAGEAKGPLDVHLIDISAEALDLGSRTLSRLPHVRVMSHLATYEAGLREAARTRRSEGAALVLFLGSNIGNFDPPEAERLLGEIRAALRPGDGFLLGADLVRPEAELVIAYDDPLGVTAAFNKNLLLRLNTELGADFDLDAWQHRALFSAAASRVEMHLVSRRTQRVKIPVAGLTIDFEEGETIWTESSYKYTLDSIAAMGARAGLRSERVWIEPEASFSTTLFRA